MIVRPFGTEDLDYVEQMLNAQPFEYKLPPLKVPNKHGELVDNPHYVSKVTVLDNYETPVAFGFSRAITESYLLLDHSWANPYQRWEAIRQAFVHARDLTFAQGLMKSVTWVPKEISKSYGRRLESLGWVKQERPSFVLEGS